MNALVRRMRAEHEAGYVAIVTAILMPVLIMLVAFCVDVARWYVEGEMQQKASDAAALAGVPYIPQDFDTAYTNAIRIAANNGYDHTKDSDVQIDVCSAVKSASTSGSVPAGCSAGLKPSQLRVTIHNNIPNMFASVFGFDTQDISRTAVTDYNGPARMGSPCNSFGNMPPSWQIGDAFPLSDVPPATCGINNGFWANIFGPDAPKRSGDQYATKVCQSGDDGCSGTTNTEYDSDGYYYLLRVLPGETGQVSVDAYDPAFIETGDLCESIDPYAYATDNMNDYTKDAKKRYAATANAAATNAPTFCTGDNWSGPKTPTTTTFELLNPTDTQDPKQATPVSGCNTQSFDTTDLSADANPAGVLQQYRTAGNAASGTNPNYKPEVARLFHQWVPLCTINNVQPGDYYIHVKTTSGSGLNRFALRARAADPSKVSIAGWSHMSIYANANQGNQSTPKFNFIRVPPGAANNSIVVNLFDVGDINPPDGTLTVLPPQNNVLHGTGAPTCTGTGPYTVTTNCVIANVNGSQSQGKQQNIVVHIPADYTCDFDSPGGCWWQIKMDFTGGGQDTTTWSAKIVGDPVRLSQ